METQNRTDNETRITEKGAEGKEGKKEIWRMVELHEIPTTQKHYEEKIQIKGFREGLVKLGLNP